MHIRKGKTMETMEEKLVRKRFDPEKRFMELGKTKIDLARLCRDARGIEDDLRQVIKEDWSEARYNDWDTRLHPFAEASDLVVQDEALLNNYPPLYTDIQTVCSDCDNGPCDLVEGEGLCSLALDPFQARLSLRVACRGCQSQFTDTRGLLDYAVREFGRDKEVSLGARHDISDQALSIAILTGQYVRNLSHLERALAYAEAQLNKLFLASYQGTGSVFDFENMTFHCGSVLLLVQEVSELVKGSCFGFQKGADRDKLEMDHWPPPNIMGGLGSIEKGKPVIAFVGDNLLPAWSAINYLKENELTEKIEICGPGPVGLDIARFYDRVRIVGTMANAGKWIRSGFADVIVASSGCVSLDILGEAKRVESRVIWVSPQPIGGLPDRTDNPGEGIINDLIGGLDAVWVRDIDKVGEIAVRVAQKVKRKGDYLLSEKKAKEEAKRCKEDCDLCFNACPNSLLIGRALRKVREEGLSALAPIEKGCYFCGKCEQQCPEKITIRDLIVATLNKRAPDDKFIMRSGRGSVPEDEIARSAFTLMNSPGFCWILSCGGGKDIEDVGWLANEFTGKGCVTLIAGCGAVEAARYFDREAGKFLFEKFTCEYAVKNISSLGGCTAMTFLQEASAHWARTGVHISHYANWAEVADITHRLMAPPVIIWGRCPERMYAVAAGLIRIGHQVIVGPNAGFAWKRYLLGNHFDRSKWCVWDTSSGRKVETEPGQEHILIPVETKEEALTIFWSLQQKPGASISIMRLLSLTPYIACYEKYFGELPDDWQWYVTTASDLPVRQKVRLLKELKEKWGWDTEGVTIKKARHRDGRLLTTDEFAHEYSTHEARFFAKTPKLVTKKAKENLRKEGYDV